MSLEEQQLQMLHRMATLDPPPCFMGGYAEDALLAGTLTRPHEDFDWLLPRRELELRTAQARRLGFSGFETWGEAAPGEPFYLYAENGGLKLDLGIADEERSSLWIKVHRLSFTVDGKEAPAGDRMRLPADLFDQPPARIDDIRIRVAAPLALYQMREGAPQGSFGEPSERQRESARALREQLLSGMTDAELEPTVERLTIHPGQG